MSDIRIKMAKDLRDMSDMVGDLHWMAAKEVEDLTKKEGEIAKRDEELAACRVAVENCEVFRARIAELEAQFDGESIVCGSYRDERDAALAELSAIKAQEPVEYQLRALIRDVTNIPEAGYYMPQSWHDQVIALSLSGKLDAPVSEAKAQVVIPDEREAFEKWGETLFYTACFERHESDEYAGRGLQGAWLGWQARAALKSAPVQQVSVPGGWRVERGYSPSGYVLHSPSGSMIRVCDSGGGGIETAFALFLKAMLYAAPAAPAADAGLDYQALFDAIAAATSVYANGAVNISVQAFRESLAAHSAEGFGVFQIAAAPAPVQQEVFKCHKCLTETSPPAPYKAYVECGECGAKTAATAAAQSVSAGAKP